MISLNKYIKESLFDIDDTSVDAQADAWVVEEWIHKHYQQSRGISIDVKTHTVDCSSNVDVYDYDIDRLLPEGWSWGTIIGYFVCSRCRKLTSLEGAPRVVHGYFTCSFCKSLKSLEGAPREVGGSFTCNLCRNLGSLKGSPERVGGSFRCEGCSRLTSLEGGPLEVGDGFHCCTCSNLKSLKGAPEVVPGTFDCSYTAIKDFDGGPKRVGTRLERPEDYGVAKVDPEMILHNLRPGLIIRGCKLKPNVDMPDVVGGYIRSI